MIVVTGATGFLGGFVVRELLKEGLPFKCLVRSSSDVTYLQECGVEMVYGDLDEDDTLFDAFRGSDTLVNLASLGFGHAPNILEAATGCGLSRAVFISTTAIFTRLEPQSKQVRVEAEKAVESSGLAYTILRPTMIYGTGKDRNMARLVKFVHKFPLVPVLGDGTRLLQPVYVKDLARAVVKVLNDKEKTAYKAYNLAGKNPLTYNETVDEVARALGKRIKKVHLPVGMALPALRVYNALFKKPLFTEEQVLRLQEDKAFSYQEAQDDFSFSPRSFQEGIRLEVEDMRRQGML